MTRRNYLNSDSEQFRIVQLSSSLLSEQSAQKHEDKHIFLNETKAQYWGEIDIFTKIIVAAPSFRNAFSVVASELIWITTLSLLCQAHRWLIFFSGAIYLGVANPNGRYATTRVTSKRRCIAKMMVPISLRL